MPEPNVAPAVADRGPELVAVSQRAERLEAGYPSAPWCTTAPGCPAIPSAAIKRMMRGAPDGIPTAGHEPGL